MIDYGRCGTKAARTRRLVHEFLHGKRDAREIPTNNRFVFYELEQRGDATKPDPNDERKHRRRNVGWPPGEQDVIDAVKWLRDAGMTPWSWITDETRRVIVWEHAPTVVEYLRDRLDEATINPWGKTPPPLILCESKATAAVLRSMVSEYVCPITGTGGQVGGFLHTEVAPLLTGNRSVRYVGDLDKSGDDIEGNSRRALERASGCTLDWQRVAITEVQAKGIKPIVKRDGRDKIERECWEAESLKQAPLVALVREVLDALLPERLVSVHEREDAEREKVEAALREALGGEAA